jgi:hypothetical protein
MKALHLMAVSAAVSGLLTVAAAEAAAQQRSSVFGARSAPPRHGGHFGGRHHRGGKFQSGHFPGFILVEREVPVIIEREVVREVPAAAPAAPPAPPRKPYVIGSTYASLPGGCMKMIEGSASYYYCGGGEWYRLVGSRGARYLAVAR